MHITSHRAADRKRPTAAWLEQIGLPFDDLHCSYDKVSRCVELEIDLLIDDGPLNLAAALSAASPPPRSAIPGTGTYATKRT